MRALLLLVALAACGDNLEPRHLTTSTSQSGESLAVLVGDYRPVAREETIGWLLSDPGVVQIQLRGLAGGAHLGSVQITGQAAVEPSISVIDQVGNESARLESTVEGDIFALGAVRHILVEPLVIGSEGEFVWIRVETGGSPITVYSLAWSAP